MFLSEASRIHWLRSYLQKEYYFWSVQDLDLKQKYLSSERIHVI